jgi:hypothetical protein
MKKWGVLLLAISLLSGCSEQTKSEPKKEVKVNQESKEDKIRKEIVDYTTQTTPVINDMTTIMNSITELSTMAANDPSLLTNPSYLETVDKVGVAIHAVNERARAIDTGTNPTINKVHNLLLKAVDRMEFVGNTYPSAVRNLDANGITECSIAISEVGDYMEQSTNIITTELEPYMINNK